MAPELQQLIRENKPIYVRNRAGEYTGTKTPYILEIREAGKQAATVVIPATKYPFHLSAHVPAKLLADSTEFYSALSKRILILLDPAEAEREMEDPIAQKVVDAALRKFQPTRRTSKPPPELVTASNRREGMRPPGADTGTSELPQGSPTPLKVAKNADAEGVNPDVNPTVIQIVMDLDRDSSLKEEKWLELAGMEDLTEDDYGYLLGNCQKFPKIVQLARTELAKLVGDEDAEEIEQEQAVAAETEQQPRRRRRKRKR